MYRFTFILVLFCHLSVSICVAQGSPDYNGGFKITFDEKQPDKFLRFISWGQFQTNYQSDPANAINETNFLLRRARLLFLSQITDDFLIVSHIGLNNLGFQNMDPLGRGDGPQIFLHDAWAQYNIASNLSLGGGLHYFNGVSRLNNQSTLNMLTLDNNRASWSTLGLSDQFARHLGVFAKGNFDKFQYQVAINNALANGLDQRNPMQNEATYNGLAQLNKSSSLYTYAGYFTYHFLDAESNYLPYKIGSYLGSKEVLTVGAGFFAHPNGGVVKSDQGNLSGEDVLLFAVDAFYDVPVGLNNASLTAYAVHQQNDYGLNYLFGPYGTGSMTYAHLGYVIPGDKVKTRFQPYLSYATHEFDASPYNRNILGVGVNAYLSGHNSKLTLEFKSEAFGDVNQETVSLQAMIYL